MGEWMTGLYRYKVKTEIWWGKGMSDLHRYIKG
jgi:hypothetical protein